MDNEPLAALLLQYTSSESHPATPVPTQQTQQHPYSAFQSPESLVSPSGASFSEAVNAELSLFEGCSILDGSATAVAPVSRYVVVMEEHLIEEEGSAGRIVVCSSRYEPSV